MVKIGNDWDRVLDGEFDKEYYLKLREFLKEEYKIIQTGEYYDLGTDKIYLYDLFSREVLCSINASDMNYNVGNFDET